MALKFKKDSRLLKEDLGSYMKQRPPQSTGPSIPYPPRNGNTQQTSNIQGVELFKFNFQSWQQNVIRALERNNSIYVVASPGAGKTAPVAYWWAQNILHLNPGIRQEDELIILRSINAIIDVPQNIPKILYLCPNRQLVYNIQNDFREYFSQMFMYAFQVIQNSIKSNDQKRQQEMFTIMQNILVKLPGNLEAIIQQRIRIFQEYQKANGQRANHLAREIQNLDNELFNKLGNSIKHFIDRHLLHPRTKVDQPPRVNHSPLVTVAIYESGRDIFKKLAKDNLRAVIVDEAHLIQERERSKNDRAEQITNNIYPIIKNVGQIQNCQLILLSGTVNPTAATNLINFFKKCFGLNIEQVRGNTRNPSDVSVLPMDELIKEDKLVNILTNPKEEGNAIILFSKRKINQVVDEALKKTQSIRRTAQQIDRGDLQKPQSPEMSINLRDYEQQAPGNQPNFSDKRIKDKINELPGAENISDPRLLNCVMGGFGYIYRQDDNTKSDAENKRLGQDQQIVADLFSKGKIKSIIATDSIGIGVNLKIKNMYVPSVSKFNGSGFETLPVSDASQLYNRVGRMAYEVSNIYTPEVNMGEILNAISASNEKYDTRTTLIKDFGQKMCQYMIQNHNIWSAAMRKLLR